jgi:predicted TIM-barrel fold metal-dependent hydrolase
MLALVLLAVQPAPAEPSRPLPVIDMHLHASRIRSPEPVPACPGDRPLVYPALDPRERLNPSTLVRCSKPFFSAATTAQLRDMTIAEMQARNVRRGVLAGDPALVADWMAKAPGLFVAAATPPNTGEQPIESLRALHAAGKAAVFAEVGAQYLGLRADDPKLEPFWTLAEQLDVPVGIHLGEGMPGQMGGATDRYRAGLTTPFQLEEVLLRHPRLRLWVMHAASPLTDEMIAMLFEYPTLYVDVAANVWNMPRAQFYDQLKRLVDAGFSKRILFGSDQTLFPQAIGLSIDTIEQAPFLTSEQKRDILYHNAARFLRLTPEQIAADHR